MTKGLKEIVESFENKLLYKYRFDKNAEKRGEICSNCKYFKNGHCSFLNDKVNPKYTCNKFEQRKNEN